MNNLRDQLLQKGLVTAEAVKKVEQKKQYEAAAADRKKGKAEGFAITHLLSVGTVAEFVDGARDLLMRQPEAINDVLEAAHRFKGSGNEKEKRLYWICYTVKDRLHTLSKDDKNLLIKRAFRRMNPTPTLPGERE